MSQRYLRRLLLIGAFAAVVTAPSAHADYSVTVVRGCWGVGVAVCDPTVTVFGVSPSTWEVPVCTGTCTYVPVPFVSVDGLHTGACVSYTGPGGTGGRAYCGHAWADSGVCVDLDGVPGAIGGTTCVIEG